MEVHHHAHTSRKKWIHYFWEFLMLFLAVFCGFLAEYLLEHKIEKEKGRQYLRSFYEDLKMDTTEFNRVIAAYHRAYSVLEGRNECYDRFMQNPEDDDCLEELFDNSSGFTDLISSDQTLLQLKNAGGFRLLDKSDADSILRYDKMIRLYAKDEMTGFQQNQYFIRETVFALRNYNRAKGQNGSVLYSDNRGLLNTYFNALNRWMLISQRLVRYLEALKMQAIELMGYFKRKYQFK